MGVCCMEDNSTSPQDIQPTHQWGKISDYKKKPPRKHLTLSCRGRVSSEPANTEITEEPIKRSSSSQELTMPEKRTKDKQLEPFDCFKHLDALLTLMHKESVQSKRVSLLSPMKSKAWSKSFHLKSPKLGRSTHKFDADTSNLSRILDEEDSTEDDPKDKKSEEEPYTVKPLIQELENFIQDEYTFLMSGEGRQAEKIEEGVQQIYTELKNTIHVFTDSNSDQTIGQILEKVAEDIESAPSAGKVDEATLEALENHRAAFINNVLTTLKRHAQKEMLYIRSIGVQLIGCLATKNALLFSAIVQTLVKQIGGILNNNCTIREVCSLYEKKQYTSSVSRLDVELTPTGPNIWDKNELEIKSPNGTGSLNHLVTNLTSTTSHESNYTKSFIMTYQSFTDPATLLAKLKERFKDIPEDISASERSQVELRVCVVLKYWIETRVFDFDSQLLHQLREFLQGPVAKQNSEMANRLVSTLDNTLESYQQKFESLVLLEFSGELVDIYLKKSVTQYFILNNFSAVAIAEQLSLMDCDMLKKIEHVGFLNQSWNKEKLQYRALSLIYFIERLNQYSYWISTMILLQPKKRDRVAILEKILDISKNLLEVQKNYHAVAGIVVGLNLAAVSRLKHTFRDLSKKHKVIMDSLNTLMNPQSSYANYRNTVKTKTLPVIPYIGVYLSDITFVDEGNPDMIDGFINFAKHDMVYNAIREVILFQQSKYDYSSILLLQNYLCALPALGEKVLYDLSLAYEPRGAEYSTIK